MIRTPYTTKQRSDIYDFFLNNRNGCFTVKEIIRSGEISAGTATIYRTLANLIARGVLEKYTDDNKLTYYRLKSCEGSGHFHLKCTGCGELIHMECDEMSRVARHIEDEHGFIVDSGITTLYGLCKSCRKKGEANE